jgi:hypothetical protein
MYDVRARHFEMSALPFLPELIARTPPHGVSFEWENKHFVLLLLVSFFARDTAHKYTKGKEKQSGL